MDCARSLLCLRYLDTHMQFKAMVPHQGHRLACFRKINGQDKRCASFPHWEHHTARLAAYRLRRPHDGIEPFRFIGVAHLRSAWLELPRSMYIGKKGMHYHLHRLAMQRKTAL